MTNQPKTDNRALLQQLANGDQTPIDYLLLALQFTDKHVDRTDPVPALCVLLEAWAANPQTDLADSTNRLHLQTLSRLISFLTELRSLHEVLILSSPLLEKWSYNNYTFTPAP